MPRSIPCRRPGKKWNTYEITVKGRDITVMLDGKETAKLRDGMFDEGPIALPSAQARSTPRKVQVKALDKKNRIHASPPLRLTIRACLDDHCRECGLLVYRCESEGGQMMSRCAGHLRLRN